MGSQIKLKACIAAYIILTSIYYRTGVLRFTLDSVNTTISFGALYIMYRYLDTRPAIHKTIINSLMKIMVLSGSIILLQGYLWSFLFNVLNETAKHLVEDHPTLMCILTGPRPVFIPFVMAVFFLLISKLYLVLVPHHFLNFNHELGTRASIFLMVLALVSEISFSLGLNRHYCVKGYFERLSYQLNIKAEASTMHIVPWLGILLIVGVLVEMTSNTVLQYRAWKQRRSVAPVPHPQAFVVSINVPNTQAPLSSGLPLNQESQNSKEQKIAQNFTLIFSMSVVPLIWHIRILDSYENVFAKNISLTLSIITFQVGKSLLPLVWITSSDETTEFVSRMLKDKILLCPPVIQNIVSRFMDIEQMD